jgi:excisionase family DNA binding protein
MEEKVLTLKEVAELLRTHPSTIYRLLRKRRIPAFKMGSDWRFNREAIDQWISEREAADSLAKTSHRPKTRPR